MPQNHPHERIRILHGRNNTAGGSDVVITTRLGAYALLGLRDSGARIELDGSTSRLEAGALWWFFPDDDATIRVPIGARYGYCKFDIVAQDLAPFGDPDEARHHDPLDAHQPPPETVWGLRPARSWSLGEAAAALPQLMLITMSWWRGPDARREAEARLGLLVARHIAHQRQNDGDPGDGLAFALAQARRHPDRRWRVPDLAALAGMGERQFTRCCRQRHGRSPGALIREGRLAAATALIEQGTRIDVVARACGYTDSTAFGRAFRACFGISPVAWRRN